jgi:hypothetical protein
MKRSGVAPYQEVLAGLGEDAIAASDDLDRTVLVLAEPDALDDEDCLAVRMGVPGGARARELTRADVVPMQRVPRDRHSGAPWVIAASPSPTSLGTPTFVRRQAWSAVSGSPNGHEILG